MMIRNISVEELRSKIDNNDKFILLDVRTPEEFEEGSIFGSVLISYDQVEEKIDNLHLNHDDEIVIYCRTGNRSRIASKTLYDLGFNNVINVLGGINEWEENGYKISRKGL